MKKLYKHVLEYAKTFEFVTKSLNETNALSAELLQIIRSRKGEFFTLLPEDADLGRIYLFDSYILKQNPQIRSRTQGGKYQLIPTIREEMYHYLSIKMKESVGLVSVFDAFNLQFGCEDHTGFFEHFGHHYRSEIYYFVDASNFSAEVVQECLRISNVIWHSLCILTRVTSEYVLCKEIDFKQIQNMCAQVQLAVIGAYDGEGYIFWEAPNKS